MEKTNNLIEINDISISIFKIYFLFFTFFDVGFHHKAIGYLGRKIFIFKTSFNKNNLC